MDDKKVLFKRLQDTNPYKWQICYQSACSDSLFTVPEPKSQGHEENIYSFIPQVPTKHQLCDKGTEFRSYLLKAAHVITQHRRAEQIISFFTIITQNKHFGAHGVA
jgi:hypothetical protein